MFASILFALLPLVSAMVTPTTPDGSTVINEGSSIDAAWAADTTGTWTNMTIQLMTGDNLNMIALRTLISGVDGTTTTTFSTPAPDVEPNSKIYFLQFTNGDDPTATWTTRFTIAAADGTTTAPEQTTNYNGEDVQWGVGAIVGEATGGNSTTSASAVSSESASASASASTSTGSGITNYGPSSTGSTIANPSNVSGPSRASNAGENASASTSDTAASASTTPNAAAAFAPKVAVGGLIGLVGVVMGLAL